MKTRENRDPIRKTDKTSMRRTAIYLRVSSDAQEEEALQAQREACVQQAAVDGAEPDAADIYEDRANGIDFDRPALKQLRQAVQAGEISVVYAHSPGRLSCNSRILFALRYEFASAGVHIRFARAPRGEPLEHSKAQGNFDIRLISRMAADGWSLLEIAILANVFEVPTSRGGRWTVDNVKELLENGTT